MLGVKLTYRDLKSAIDDICDPYQMAEVLEERGIDSSTVEIPGCFMFNPGGTNTFSLADIDEDGVRPAPVPRSRWIRTTGASRIR
jgi:hypothetical protein